MLVFAIFLRGVFFIVLLCNKICFLNSVNHFTHIFVSHFAAGKRQGQGVMRYATGQVASGEWDQNRLSQPGPVATEGPAPAQGTAPADAAPLPVQENPTPDLPQESAEPATAPQTPPGDSQ